MSRLAFIQEFRESWAQNPMLAVVSQLQLERYLDLALSEYSRFHPRKDLEADVSLVSGNRRVTLPIDIIPELCDPNELALIDSGASTPQQYIAVEQRVPSYVTTWSLSPVYTEVTEAKMPRITIERITIGYLEQDRYVLVLDTAPTSNATVTIHYVGRHLVQDADPDTGTPAINTLSWRGKEKVTEHMRASVLFYQARHFVMIDSKQSQQYMALAEGCRKEFLRGLHSIGI